MTADPLFLLVTNGCLFNKIVVDSDERPAGAEVVEAESQLRHRHAQGFGALPVRRPDMASDDLAFAKHYIKELGRFELCIDNKVLSVGVVCRNSRDSHIS